MSAQEKRSERLEGARVPARVLWVARTFPFALKAVVSFSTQSDGTGLPRVSWLTQTHPVGVVAFAVVLTAACLRTASPISSNCTFVLTPVQSKKCMVKDHKFNSRWSSWQVDHGETNLLLFTSWKCFPYLNIRICIVKHVSFLLMWLY